MSSPAEIGEGLWERWGFGVGFWRLNDLWRDLEGGSEWVNMEMDGDGEEGREKEQFASRFS